MNTPKRSVVGLICATLAVSLLTGCSGLTSKKESSSLSNWMPKMPWSGDSDEHPEPYPNPVKMAATWTPDTLVQSGKTPTRGFGGRLYFFNEKSKVVPVEGTLTIHGFDETAGPQKANVKPFRFTPEQFTKHFSQSDLGASYSIWIPWDAVGGEKKRVSLVATFKTTEGKIVQGVPATIDLPGRESAEQKTELLAPLSPQFRAHQRVAASPSAQPSGLVTTTIPGRTVPKNAMPTGPRSFSIPQPNEEIKDMIANGKKITPYIDVSRSRQPVNQPTIRPASAVTPTGAPQTQVPNTQTLFR